MIRVPIRAPRRLRYRGTRKARLWRLRAAAIALALTLGAAASGCSLSFKLDSLRGDEGDKAEHTGSIRAAPATKPSNMTTGAPG